MTSDLATVDVIAEDLPGHEGAIAQYVAAGLDRRQAFDLEITAAKIISRGRRTIVETGRDLLSARQAAQYGTWGAFLARCGIEERTAQNYMRVAETFGDKPEIISALPPTALYALAAPTADPARVAEVVAEVEAGAQLTTAEVKERLAPWSLPMDFVLWQRRAAAVGCDLTVDEGAREFVLSRPGQAPIRSAQWPNVTIWIQSQEPPPPADVTPEAETAAERLLIAAQDAGPGSAARGERLIEAKAAIRMLDDAELREALAVRWRTLHSEHEAAQAAEQEIALPPPPAPAAPLPPALTPRPSALPPALPTSPASPQAVEARKQLACKRALLLATLALVEEQLAAQPGPVVVVREEAARDAARMFAINPTLGAAAAMLGFSARVESEAA